MISQGVSSNLLLYIFPLHSPSILHFNQVARFCVVSMKGRLETEMEIKLCDHLEGWDREGGRETQEGGDMGIYVYVWLIHFVIKRKLTQHRKAIILP